MTNAKTAHRLAVKRLAYYFRAARPTRPVLLLGAGASYQSGIPTADQAVYLMAQWAYAKEKLGLSLQQSSPSPADYLPFLRGQPWFVSAEDRLADNYASAVTNFLVPRESRKEFFLHFVRPVNGVNNGYLELAKLLQRGLCRTILTTNFDSLVVDGIRQITPYAPEIVEVNKILDDLYRFEVNRRCQIVYLHGSVEYYSDRNSGSEISSLDPHLVNKLEPLLASSPLIVIGYRGVERSIMHDLFEHAVPATNRYRHGLFWCTLANEALHPNVRHLEGLIDPNFQHLEILGFDQLMEDLNEELIGDDLIGIQTASKGLEETGGAATGALDDLDNELLLSTLQEYARRCSRSRITSDNVLPFMRELSLVTGDMGYEAPTRDCYLLFGRAVRDEFPNAGIAVTKDGKSRQVFAANLLTLRRELLEYLDSDEINGIVRVKRRASSSDQRAYPTRAITELITNVITHRDYDAWEPAMIEITTGDSITFINPGGLMPSAMRTFKPDLEGRFEPVRDESAVRNRVIADILHGVGLMEKAGSGLVDVADLAEENAGSASFEIRNNNTSFSAILKQPLEKSPASRIATPRVPTGLYITNMLPFMTIPERCWKAIPLKDQYQSQLPTNGLPIVAQAFGKLLSFANLSALAAAQDLCVPGSIAQVDRRQVLGDADERRLLSQLLRLHWEAFLGGFMAIGLTALPHEHRAYFKLVSGEENTIVYRTPLGRTVQRRVVKRRGSDANVTHENEGIAYRIVHVDDMWAVRIKPFYMFTADDGVTPLPGWIRTKRSTRRMKFDRNRNVDDDLTFWSRLVSGGQQALGLHPDLPDLVLSSSFAQVDVLEKSLL